jgi:hypothetical protein
MTRAPYWIGVLSFHVYSQVQLNFSGTTGQWVKVTFNQRMELDGTRELLAYTKDFILLNTDVSITHRRRDI